MTPRFRIALSLSPRGMAGCLARAGGRGWAIVRWRDASWSEPTGQDLSGRVDEIRRFTADLGGDADSAPEVFVALHQSWCLARSVAIPVGARPREIGDILGLQAQRFTRLLHGDDLRWGFSWVRKPSRSTGAGEVLLHFAKPASVAPVEEALAEAQLTLGSVAPAAAAVAAGLAQWGGIPYSGAALVLESAGATLVGYGDEGVAQASWFAGDLREADGVASFWHDLSHGTLSGAEVLLVGAREGRERVAEGAPDWAKPEWLSAESSPKGFSTTTSEAVPWENPAVTVVVVGLLAANKEALPNLAASGAARSLSAGVGVQSLLRPVVAGPLLLGLLMATMLVGAAAARFQMRLYAGVADRAAAVTRRVEVDRANLATLERFRRERFDMLGVMADLSELLPNGVLLTALRLDREGDVEVTGNGPSYGDAEQFAARLNEHARFRDARTERMGQGQKGVRFRIECTLAGARRRGRVTRGGEQ